MSSPGVAPAGATGAPRGTLLRAVRLLDVDRRRLALAVLLGTLALGCAVALAGTAAWLIARASQMPPVMYLTVATVAVRAFGIGRGVLRYCERLVSHDLALRGMTTLRTTLYERLAAGRPDALVRLRHGDLLARVGADVDAVGDVVVRGLLPAAVAAVLGVGTVAAMCAFWVPAGLALAGCLLLAGVAAPALAARGARTAERRAVQARADMTATALGLLDDAGPLSVAGRVGTELTALRDADARIAAATDAGARPAALAAGLGQVAVGVAVLAALVTGIPAVARGALAPVELAVIVLTPLAAFEATGMLPAAALQVQRSRAAAARILALLDASGDPAPELPRRPAPGAGLVARDLACGWPGRPPVVTGLDLDLRPGRAVALVGSSGAGKTTTLLTLAGLLPAVSGTVGRDDDEGPPSPDVVVAALEDGHVFGTTVLENLRVARGDVTPTEARATLGRVGLDRWLAGLPDGLDTLLGPDARTVSGGERRRLLLARALLSPAPVLLVDEPAEHLDPQTADAVVGELFDAARSGRRAVLVVTHRLSALAAADEVVLLGGGHVMARGTHTDLLARVPGYREAIERETATRPGPPLGTDEGDTRAGDADAAEPADRDPVGGGRLV
ncbi:thiol reductant ABC exporter subunit CydC [Cellulomonas chitinilytica]|uniref:Thiol reductant ABC exporter subunit CydC n=1 Tax=Cellulomonas chitinilytica TaxID=398759 RepID=A0A919P1T5_9CELL|nr:thiol reductant ABC exporter subunit CydC [Cellulomonas chitinilytica]GIG20101.1 thiol reductant ABC exporter subunit CydC [Cellulomonas chitinilytica]